LIHSTTAVKTWQVKKTYPSLVLINLILYIECVLCLLGILS
jgi:hypothetical protein